MSRHKVRAVEKFEKPKSTRQGEKISFKNAEWLISGLRNTAEKAEKAVYGGNIVGCHSSGETVYSGIQEAGSTRGAPLLLRWECCLRQGTY